MDWKSLFASRAFTALGTLALAVAAFLLYLRYVPALPPVYTSQPGPLTVAPVPPKAAKVKTVIVEKEGPTKFIYIPKPELATALKMPEVATIHDNVIAVAEAAPHKGKTTVIATIGPDSDNVYRGGILMRQEPVPFWGWEREWHGGIWYGPAGRNTVQGELEFLPMRIGPVYPSIKGIVGLESGGNWNGQLLLGVRF